MAEELGLIYKLHPIGPRTGETQTLEFKSLNPKQKIPLLKHEDFFLSESVSICRYLRSISPSENIYQPKIHQDVALEDSWCNFIYGELDETSLYIMRRHHDLQHIYGGSPVVVNSCRRYFEKNLPVVEEVLEERGFLCGHDFGLADILLVSCLDWSSIYQIELPKNTTKYLEKIRMRDAYQKAFKINYKDLVL
jgi:glutathione S-transferase